MDSFIELGLDLREVGLLVQLVSQAAPREPKFPFVTSTACKCVAFLLLIPCIHS